jgi:holo-[acyl-carrier protein] synthase
VTAKSGLRLTPTSVASKADGRSYVEGAPAIEAAVRLLAVATGAPALPSLRVGADVCDVATLRRQLSMPTAKHFLEITFTPTELLYCAGRAERLAARWAAKEAVAKAIGSGFRGLRPIQIEIARRPDGAPLVRAADNRPWPDGADSWKWAVSLAHDGGVAIAVAIAVTNFDGAAQGVQNLRATEARWAE